MVFPLCLFFCPRGSLFFFFGKGQVLGGSQIMVTSLPTLCARRVSSAEKPINIKKEFFFFFWKSTMAISHECFVFFFFRFSFNYIRKLKK